MPTFPALGRRRQETRELKASLSYTARALTKERKEKSQGLNDGLEMGERERMARDRTDSHSAMALKIKPGLTITTLILFQFLLLNHTVARSRNIKC